MKSIAELMQNSEELNKAVMDLSSLHSNMNLETKSE